ncbi:hypothetical protein OIE71_14175 [Streptomyces sp. NBC_01725]|uniref:hypothetical protein n=1 Tax=unclassified Streptomyces TaxID=2593676 RepID=UPI0011CAB614|nr:MULTISPECIES: hypothetical protein [unclassified Streptomyces]TXL87360.1 hypothetical protein EW053_24215 [Streptomyces sp. IB2014 016-6]
MTRTSDIGFTFAQPLSIREALHSLGEVGLTLTQSDQVSYVIDRDKMFDWTKENASCLQNIIDEADRAEPGETTFGVTSYFGSSIHGGDLLFHEDRLEISFMVTVNKRTLPGSQFCDFGWYLNRLVPPFEQLGLVEFTATDLR